MSTGGGLLGISVLELRTDQRPLNTGLATARTSVDRTGAQMQRSMDKRMVSVGGSMSKAGGAMSRNLTVPIVALGGAAATMAAHFESAMEMVHTQAGASQKEVDTLKNKVLELAKVSPQGPQQLAEGLFHLESIGLRGAKAMDALKIASEGAAVGGSNLEDTATALGSAWLVNIKGAGNLHQVMGTLNATVGAGNVRMGELVQALGVGLLPAAKVAGLSLQDVMGAMAVFTDEGYQASSAAAQFATSLHFLYNPTAKATGALKDIGLGSNQLAEDMHKPQGLLTALTDLRDHLDKLPGGIKGVKSEQILGDILPAGRGRILITLLNQLDRYDMKLKQISRTSSQFDADVTKTQEQPLYRIHVAWSRIQADAIDFGEKVLPTLLGVGKDIVDDADKVATAFSHLPKGAQDAIITGGLVLAGIGPAMKILGLFTTGIGKLMQVEQAAQRLATTGSLRKIDQTVTSKLGSSVATMEVGTLIAKSMLGAAEGSTSWPLKGTSTVAATTEAEAAGAGGAIEASTASKLLGAGARLLGVAGLAALAAPIAVPLVGALIKALQGESYGEKLADTLSKGFGGEMQKQLHTSVAKSLDDANRLQQQQQRHQQQQAPHPTGVGGRGVAVGSPGALVVPGLTVTQVAKRIAEQRDAGTKIAKALADGWNQYKFQSEPIMFSQLRAEIRKMPPQTQAAAIQSALAFAKGLEAQHRLPAGAFKRMLDEVNRQFPGWQHQLGAWASLSADTFTKELDFTKAEKNTKDALDKMRSHFPEVTKAMDSTSGSVIDKAGAAAKALEQMQKRGGAAGKLAAADMQTLRKSVNSDLDSMRDRTVARIHDMHDALVHGSGDAANAAGKNLKDFETSVFTAMASGLTSSTDGANKIGDALNKVLKSFGTKPIPLALLAASEPKHMPTFVGGGHSGHFAGGGVMHIGRTGEAGTDTVPLNVSGQNIVVGHGEKVIVANRWQWPVLNRALAKDGYAGVEGMFQKIKRPNYMASGGVVPGFATGGLGSPGAGGDAGAWRSVTASAESLGGTGYQSNPISAFGYSELGIPPTSGNVGTALGRLPYLTHMRIRAGSAQVVAAKEDIGTGSTNNGDYPAMGLYPGTVSQLGLPAQGMYHVSIERADGVPLTIGGGGAGGVAAAIWKNLIAPTVKGTGTVPDIVRQALKQETSAANAYGQAHMPAPPSGGGGGGGGVGVSGPKGLGTLDGHQVADWIIPILNWARLHGWTGQVTSGFRGGFDPAAPSGSEHALTQYPGGAIDVGDPSAVSAGTNLYDVLKGYPGHPNLLWGGIYITGETGPGGHDYGHFSGTGHARGGVVDGLHASRGLLYATSGLSGLAHSTKQKAAPKPKKPVHHTPPKPIKTPKLKTPKGFDQTGVNHLQDLSDLISGVGSWQGFIDGMHGRVGVSPTVTLADGTDAINWGDPNAMIGALTGLVDPSTNQTTKSIYDRLREIGEQTDRMNPAAPSIKDTELGIDETLLGLYFGEQATAGSVEQALVPWLAKAQGRKLQETNQVAWLTKAIDTTTPYGQLGKVSFADLGAPKASVQPGWFGLPLQEPEWGWQIRHAAQEYKNMLAKIERLKQLQQGLPIERRDREAALKRRYDIAKHKISVASTTASFDPLSDQLVALTTEETAARDAIPTAPPKGWKGDREAWHQQHQSERDQIVAEFDARRQALKDAMAKHKLEGRLSRSNALFALGLQHDADRTSLLDQLDGQGNSIKDAISGDGQLQARDKKFLSGFLTQIRSKLTADTTDIATVTDSGGTSDTLKSYLGPLSDVAINIATMVNTNIPDLLSEVGQLRGTVTPAAAASTATATADATLAGLYQQKATTLAQELAVSQSQIKAFQIPAFGGTFHTGGVIGGGRIGDERMIRAQVGERVIPIGGDGPNVRVRVEDHRTRVWVDDVEHIVDHKMRQTSRGAIGAAKLPGARGRYS